MGTTTAAFEKPAAFVTVSEEPVVFNVSAMGNSSARTECVHSGELPTHGCRKASNFIEAAFRLRIALSRRAQKCDLRRYQSGVQILFHFGRNLRSGSAYPRQINVTLESWLRVLMIRGTAL
jgi:hypothetical protein